MSKRKYVEFTPLKGIPTLQLHTRICLAESAWEGDNERVLDEKQDHPAEKKEKKKEAMKKQPKLTKNNKFRKKGTKRRIFIKYLNI